MGADPGLRLAGPEEDRDVLVGSGDRINLGTRYLGASAAMSCSSLVEYQLVTAGRGTKIRPMTGQGVFGTRYLEPKSLIAAPRQDSGRDHRSSQPSANGASPQPDEAVFAST